MDGQPNIIAPSQAGGARSSDLARFLEVRGAMPSLAAGLSVEDLSAQSASECSPGKWHLAHSSWFFEALILSAQPS